MVTTPTIPSDTGPSDTGLRVIGAGWGRTGTASLKQALEQLGFGPCHHMVEVIKHPAEVPTWQRAARGEKIDWVAFMAPWRAAVDFPSALYYRELMEAFPDAKVILTTRDADGWYESMRTTIVPSLTRWPNRWIVPHLPYISGPARSMGQTRLAHDIIERFADKGSVLKAFEEANAEVKRVVAKERLLVFHPKEGWEPLCAFLGVPIPEGPFPKVNDAAEFQKRVKQMTVVSWVLLLLPFLIATVAAAILVR